MNVTQNSDSPSPPPPPGPSASWPRWPFCNDEMVRAASQVLESGQLNYWTGNEGKKFESEFADFVGSQHAIAVSNGTVGLELALATLEIGPGDEVIVPSRTFIATASAVVMRGAKPICADVDPETQNLTAETIRAQLSSKTRAVIPVHLAGLPCQMNPILELARQHDLRVIEDCSQAHGARYLGHHVGSLGDIGVFSFCQDKIMTTGGEGGMVVTNDPALWKKAWSFKDHGKCYDTVHRPNHPPGFRWLHKSFGTNWRMTEMQSAIGRVALRELPGWIEQRRRNALLLLRRFKKIDSLRTPTPPKNCFHSFYKFYTFVRTEKLKPDWNRDRIIQEVLKQGVPCFSGSCGEIYLEKAFTNAWEPVTRHPVAQELSETSLMFRVDPALDHTFVTATCDAVEKVLRQASTNRSPLKSDQAA